jgi:hypothetical protein
MRQAVKDLAGYAYLQTDGTFALTAVMFMVTVAVDEPFHRYRRQSKARRNRKNVRSV